MRHSNGPVIRSVQRNTNQSHAYDEQMLQGDDRR